MTHVVAMRCRSGAKLSAESIGHCKRSALWTTTASCLLGRCAHDARSPLGRYDPPPVEALAEPRLVSPAVGRHRAAGLVHAAASMAAVPAAANRSHIAALVRHSLALAGDNLHSHRDSLTHRR